MGLEAVDKLRITSFIRNHSSSDIYVSDFFVGVKTNKYSEFDVLKYLMEFIDNKLKDKKEQIAPNYLHKLFNAINMLILALIYEKYEFKENEIKDLIKLKESYISYLDNFKLEDELNTLEIIKQFVDALGDLNYNDEILNKYKEEISILKEKIKELDKIIEEKNNDFKKLGNNLSRAIKEKEKDSKVIANYVEKINNCNDTIAKLQKMIDDLNNKLAEITEKYNDILKDQRNCDKLNDKVTKAKETIKKQEEIINGLRKIEKEKDLNEYNKKIIEILDAAVFDIICDGSYTILEIKDRLKNMNIYSSDENIRESLKRIQKRVNLRGKVVQIPEVYGLRWPNFLRNQTLKLNVTESCLNLILVSDMHISSISESKKYWLDQLYSYAALNDVKLIINLGDFIQDQMVKDNNKKSIINMEKLVDEIVLKFPRDKNITHVIMGGNHDMNMSYVGLDPIDMVTKNRDDFINLGYEHANLCINKESSETKNNIYFHHPDFRLTTSILEEDNIKKVIQHLNSYYLKNSKKRDDSYIDIFGHFHKSSLDVYNGICVIPSYFFDRVQNGAWHLKVYLNDKGINNIVFIPLVCADKLTPTTEITYQKVLSNENNHN